MQEIELAKQAATIDEQGEVISRLEEGLVINERDCNMETGKNISLS